MQIAMNDACIVRSRERTSDLRCDVRRLVLGKRSAGAEPIGEPLALDLLDGDEHVALLRLPHVEHEREPFVLHLRGALRLAEESFATRAAALGADDVHHGNTSAVGENGAIGLTRRVAAELLLEPEPPRKRGSRDRARGVHGGNRHIDSRN